MLFHIHWFKFVFRKATNKYYQCRCGKKKVVFDTCGFSPVNREWIKDV